MQDNNSFAIDIETEHSRIEGTIDSYTEVGNNQLADKRYNINVALSTNPDSADKDRVTWAASTLSKEFLNLTSYDGAIYNKNTPMEPRDFLIKMQDIAKKRDIRLLYTPEYQDFNKLPDDLNAQYEFAKSHGKNTVNNKLGTMASRLVSQNRITKDEYAELNDNEKKEADELMQAETTTPRVKELKDIAEKRKTVREYQNQLKTENAWAIAAGVKAALNEEGQAILERALNNLDNIENTVGLEFMAFAGKNPQEAKMLAVALHAIQPQPSNSALWDGVVAFGKGIVDTPMEAWNALENYNERAFVNAEEYQQNREYEAIVRRAFESKQSEHDWFGDAVVGFFSTIPYMAYAALPYGTGFAVVALAAANDFEKQVVDAGGDVTDPDFFYSKFAVGAAYAAIEKVQVIKPALHLKNKGLAMAYANMYKNIRDFSKVAMNRAGKLTVEVWEEGLQEALARGFVAYGLDKDMASEAARGLAEGMHASIGPFIPIVAIEGAGRRRMHRRGGMSTSDVANAVSRMNGIIEEQEGKMMDAAKVRQWGKEYGTMAMTWANAGGSLANRVAALEKTFGLSRENAVKADAALGEMYKAVKGDANALSDFFAGGKMHSAIELASKILGNAEIIDNEDGTQTLRGTLGADANGKTVSFTFRRGRFTVDPESKAQAPSIISALTKAKLIPAGTTVEDWFNKYTPAKRAALVEKADLHTGGSFLLTAISEDLAGSEEIAIDENIIKAIARAKETKGSDLEGIITIDEDALPQTAFHEAMHGFLKVVEKLSPDLHKALKVAYPAVAANETLNEERLADNMRDYLTGKIKAVEFDKDLFDRIIDTAKSWLGIINSMKAEELRIKNAKTAQEHLFNQLLTGDFTGIPELDKMEDVKAARERKAKEEQRQRETENNEKKAKEEEATPAEQADNKFGGKIVEADNEMVDENGNLVKPEEQEQALREGRVIMTRAEYEKRKGKLVAPKLTDAEERERLHAMDDSFQGTDATGKSTITTPNGEMQVETQLAVVDASDLVTSDKPNYNPSYQNRLGRENSKQIEKIAQAPNPALLGASPTTDQGAPLVKGDTKEVIAGNGRILALARGDEEYHSTEAYNAFVRSVAEKYGLTIPEGVKHPRLVRIITSDLSEADYSKLAVLSNQSDKRIESTAGNMKSDGMLLNSNRSETQGTYSELISDDPDATLSNEKNLDFVWEVVRALNDASLLTADESNISVDGWKRIRNAVLGAIVTSHAHADSIIKTLAEDSTLNIDNILNAIRDEAHHLLKVKASAGKEVYDITPDIADALKDYIDFKHSGISDIDAFLAQQDMFANRPSLTASIMREFFAKKASQQQIADTLREYAKLAMLQDNDTPALFETAVAPRERLWELAVNKATGERYSIEAGVSSTPTAEEVAEARRQYDEVVARYTNPDGTKKPGWMKAPNGKPTKLTEEQWVWVRTPNFKKWFGDWEGAQLLDLAEKAWDNKNFIDKFVFTPSDGLSQKLSGLLGHPVSQIVITADAVRHMKKHHGDSKTETPRGQIAMTAEDALLIPYILNNFDDAVRVPASDMKHGEKAVEIRKRINGIAIVATIEHGKNKQFVVSGWKKMSAASMLRNASPKLNVRSAADIQMVQQEIAEVKRSAKNSSKVVDENGEPLVVYHGTSTEFDTFRKGSVFATDNQGVADEYGSLGAMPLFMNIRNPYVVDAFGQSFDEIYNADGKKKANKDLTEEDYERLADAFFEGDITSAKEWFPKNEQGEVNLAKAYGETPRSTNEWADYARTKGYDGVIIRDVNDTVGVSNIRATDYITFNPNQIKSATDNIGTYSQRNAIRWSITAEEDRAYLDAVRRGDTETAQRMVDEAAERAMKNSKIRDEDGKLIKVYHGTQDMFYEFDTSKKGGKNGTAEGFGIYTSDNPEVTSAYGDRQIKMYANITKPATSTQKTISAASLAKLIKDTCKKQAQQMVDDGEYDSVKDALMDTWVSNYVYTYDIGMERAYREVANSILQANDNDMDIIQEVMAGMAIRDYSEAMEFYRDSLTPITGFDGFVTQWKNSNTGKKSNIILAFDSNQLKSADPVTYDDAGNVIPLSERFNPEKDDIRWSISGIYTGSAADYEKPSLHYVGTGEGSQVYGWGLYGSNVRGVAEGYAMPSGLEIRRHGKIVKPWDDKIANLIRANFTSRNPIESALKKAKEYKAKGYGWEQKDIESLENGDYEVGAPHSNLYEQTFFTNRAPGDESHLLVWYGNVSDPRNNFAEQKKWIRTQAKKEGVKLPRDIGGWGEDIYNTLANVLGSPQAASEFLARAGIDGVKYPVDSYGKTVKDGDEVGWNYVSFRDDNIRVDHKWVDGAQRWSVDSYSNQFLDSFTNPQVNNNISQSAPTVNGADVNSRSSIEANVANARLKSQQILDSIKGTVLGDAINKDFKETSTANLIGQTITSPEDLAALAQIYRNPSFETFRYFFVKNGEVVWQTGVTARLPSNAPVTVPASGRFVESDTMQEIMRMHDVLQPDTVYLLHNHPSGNVAASAPDIKATQVLAQFFVNEGINFGGHIIIDHNVFGMVDAFGNFIERPMSLGSVATYENSRMWHPQLLTAINSPADLAKFAADLQRLCEAPNGNVFTLIGANAKGKVVSIANIPTESFAGDTVEGVLKAFQLETGAADLLIAGDLPINAYAPEIANTLKTAFIGNVIKDFVSIFDTDGLRFETLLAAGLTRQPNANMPNAERVEDGSERYEIEGEASPAEVMGMLEAMQDKGGQTLPTLADVPHPRYQIEAWGNPYSYSKRSLVQAMATADLINGNLQAPERYRELAEKLGVRTKDDIDYVAEAKASFDQLKDTVRALQDKGLTAAQVATETAKLIDRKRFGDIASRIMSQSAKYGVDVGGAAMTAWQKIMKRLAAEAKGLDLAEMQMDTGADLLNTIIDIMPEEFGGEPEKASADYDENGENENGYAEGEFVGPPDLQTWEEWQANEADRLSRYNRVIALVKASIEEKQKAIRAREARRAAQETAKTVSAGGDTTVDEHGNTVVDIDEDTAAGEEPISNLAIPREILESHRIDLNNADQFAAFIRAWVTDWLVRKNPSYNIVNVLNDPTNLAIYRKTIIAQLRNLADGLLDPALGKASIKAERMISDIPDDASPATLERRSSDILAYIQRNAVRQKRKTLIAELSKTIDKLAIKGKQFDALERDMNRKIRGEHEAYARYIKKIISFSENRVQKESEALTAIINGRTQQYDETAEEYGIAPSDLDSDIQIHIATEKLAALQQYGGLKNKSPAYIKAAARQLETWLDGERMKHEEKWSAFQLECDNTAKLIQEAVRATQAKYTGDEPNLAQRAVDDLITSVRQRLERMMLGSDDATRSEAIRRVMKLLNEGSQKLEVTKVKYRQQFEQAVKKAVEGTDITPRQLLKQLEELIPEELNDKLITDTQRNRMTWGQALQLYASLRQTATYGENIIINARQGQEEEIRNAATPEMLKLVDLLHGIYATRRDELSQVVAQVTGNPIWNPDPLYMPVKMATGREGLDTKTYAWSPLAKSLTPRVKNRLDFDLTANIIDIYASRTEETAQAIAFGVRGIALRSILARKDTLQAMSQTHGKFPTRRLIEQVTDTLTGGYTLNGARGGFMSALQKAGSFTTYAALSFNIVTAIKQMTSIPMWTAVLQGGYMELGRHLMNFDKEAAKELISADGFTARYGSSNFASVVADALNGEGNIVKRLAQAGMTAIQIGDFVPGIVVGTGVYKARLHALMVAQPNTPAEILKEQAATETWALIEECQQTSRMENTPHILRRWGVIGKQLTKFATAPMQQVAHELHAYRMMVAAHKAGNEELAQQWRKKLIQIVVANHILLPSAMYAVATLFGLALGGEPPEEDELYGDILLQLIVGPYSSILFAGGIIEATIGGILRIGGLKPNVYDDNPFAAQQTLHRIIKKGMVTTGDIIEADWASARDNLLDMVSIANAPIRYATKAVRNYTGYDSQKERQKRKREIRKANSKKAKKTKKKDE